VEKLADYSGKMNPIINYEDFSSEALVKLWKATAELYIIHTIVYMAKVAEKLGEETAREIDLDVWKTMTPEHVKKITDVMDITGTDIESILKYYQMEPGAGAMFPEFECEMKSPNHGLLKIKTCWGCEYCEATGDMSLLKYGCEDLDGAGFPLSAQCINPDVKVTPLKVPPRASKDEPACIWEFQLESKC